ncbi:MAG: hypothetical protein L0Z62_18860 [Gemmataceae bacterium]|nr:hypothetical protein [Gemmataceae bacterium]
MRLIGLGVFFSVSFPLVAGEADQKRRAKEEAQAMMNAYFKGDLEKFVGYLPPRLVDLAGGREKLLATMNSVLEQAKALGLKIQSVEVGDPVTLVGKGKTVFAVIPTTQVMAGRGVKITERNHLIGSSTDGGQRWTFVRRAKKNREELRKVLPDLPEDLKLPAPQERTIEKTK